MWKAAEEEGFRWELWESRGAGQAEQYAHVTLGLVVGKCHADKVHFWGTRAPHYQRQCCIAPGPVPINRVLSSKILPSTALCRQCS